MFDLTLAFIQLILMIFCGEANTGLGGGGAREGGFPQPSPRPSRRKCHIRRETYGENGYGDVGWSRELTYSLIVN